MELDKAMAERVWQRVQGSSSDPAKGILEMILEEWQDARLYRHLANQFSGTIRQKLLKMAGEEDSHTACLKGIYTLITGKQPRVPTLLPQHTGSLLRMCYGREMQRLAKYEARAQDPEYGRIFRDMAQQERQHCRLLLEILGSK